MSRLNEKMNALSENLKGQTDQPEEGLFTWFYWLMYNEGKGKQVELSVCEKNAMEKIENLKKNN